MEYRANHSGQLIVGSDPELFKYPVVVDRDHVVLARADQNGEAMKKTLNYALACAALLDAIKTD
jgi:hypothetical protein